MIQITNNSQSFPTAAITMNRNRVKTYGHSVYMKNGANFEIELFNPLSSKILAVVKLDGKLISSNGIVINPGQRVFLERWIDEAKKFVFSTYEIENTEISKKAILNNGKVEISFYEEVNKYFYPTFNNWGIIYTDQTFTNDPWYYNGTVTNTISDYNFSASANFSRSKSLETGRAEKGENSNQSLIPTTGDFSSIPVAVVEMKILPESQKPIEIEKIRQYCTSCGTRVRANSWKFCPSCGEKL